LTLRFRSGGPHTHAAAVRLDLRREHAGPQNDNPSKLRHARAFGAGVIAGDGYVTGLKAIL
jgi:hypothetical protein